MLVQRIFLISIKGLSNVRSFSNDFTFCSNPLFPFTFSTKFIFERSYFCYKVTNCSCTFCNSETWSFNSSIDFINSSRLRPETHTCAMPPVVVPVIVSAVTTGTLGVGAIRRVERTAVETTGITLGGWEVDSPCLSFNDFSSSYSVSFSCSLSLRTRFINFSSDLCCMTSVMCGCLEGGSFSCFLKVAMSTYFFLIKAFAAFTSLGS